MTVVNNQVAMPHGKWLDVSRWKDKTKFIQVMRIWENDSRYVKNEKNSDFFPSSYAIAIARHQKFRVLTY